MEKTLRIRQLTTLSLLTALITITGALKLPGILPGTEFQLSAPLAVAICGIFGIKEYILSGVLSSTIGLILGTQNLFSVFIAMVFRLVVAFIFLALGNKKLFFLLSGPLATLTSRLILSIFIDKAVLPLILTALPGMLFTLLTSGIIAKALEKICFHREIIKENATKGNFSSR